MGGLNDNRTRILPTFSITVESASLRSYLHGISVSQLAYNALHPLAVIHSCLCYAQSTDNDCQ